MTKVFNRISEKTKRRGLRNNMPKPEVLLWSKLKGKGLNGYKFRRQHSIGSFIVDFYCPEFRLAIEVDGNSHFLDGAEEADRIRESEIEKYGITFLRFTNNDICENLEVVIERISERLPERGAFR
ncbi:MAG: endonuclease domain-containing protein [Deltaproteobacteria bacterium]|nr:endonuclease domain-containing protein [Deltaproteobacteria bacterium]